MGELPDIMASKKEIGDSPANMKGSFSGGKAVMENPPLFLSRFTQAGERQ